MESIRECVRGLRLNGAPPNASRAGRNGAMSILIENTAGQGSSIGWSFEQLAWLLRELDDVPVDVCSDTAHTYASATTFRPKRDCDRRFELSMVRSGSIESLIHCNDSKTPLNSRVDRHQHIGLGYIGAEGSVALPVT